jgi:hypothetical protein
MLRGASNITFTFIGSSVQNDCEFVLNVNKIKTSWSPDSLVIDSVYPLFSTIGVFKMSTPAGIKKITVAKRYRIIIINRKKNVPVLSKNLLYFRINHLLYLP